MKDTIRQKWIAYGVTAAIGLVVVLAVAVKQGLSAAQSFPENCRDLSDGFFVVGLMMACVGGLSCIASTGFFDIFSFGARTLASHFVPKKDAAEMPKYYDYKVVRAEKRKPPRRTMLWIGVAFLALSMLCYGGYAM